MRIDKVHATFSFTNTYYVLQVRVRVKSLRFIIYKSRVIGTGFIKRVSSTDSIAHRLIVYRTSSIIIALFVCFLCTCSVFFTAYYDCYTLVLVSLKFSVIV